MEIPILLEPRYGHCKLGKPYTPTFREVVSETLEVLNFFGRSHNLLVTTNFCFECLASVLFFYFLFNYFYIATFALFIGFLFILGTFYNTVWYHRYCSHGSFTFTKRVYVRLLLWTNPLAIIFREEIYAIPHRNHHLRTDQAGDPYGPHLGWLASFLAPELTQRLNHNIPEKEFDSLKASLSDIGFHHSTFFNFRKFGSIESPTYYLLRAIFAQFFWAVIFIVVGGISCVVTWYAAIFVITCLIRDFNWRGHGGNFRKSKIMGWEFDRISSALNQRFYGFIASEWHDNHHKYPFSANNGFLPGQIDIAFQIIRLMHRLGIVSSYIDAKPVFEKDCLGTGSNNRGSILAGS